MEKNINVKSRQKELTGDLMKEFLHNLDSEIFKKTSNTSNSVFFRCVRCRIAKVRLINDLDKYFVIKAHTKNCNYRRIKLDESEVSPTELQKIEIDNENLDSCPGSYLRNIEDNQSLINNAIERLEMNSNISIYLKGQANETKLKNTVCWKLPKITEEDTEIFQSSFKNALKHRKLNYMDDLLFLDGYNEFKKSIPQEVIETVQEIDFINLNTFKKFKENTKKMIYGPMEVKFD